MPKKKPCPWLNLPNCLSLGRGGLGLVIGLLIGFGRHETAFILTIAAILFDALDGWLARRFDQVTAEGKVIDAGADKLLMVSIALAIGLAAHPPLWSLLAVAPLIAIEASLALLGLIGWFFRDQAGQYLGANQWGKAKMLCESLLIAGLWLWFNPFNWPLDWLMIGPVGVGLTIGLIISATICALQSVKLHLRVYHALKARHSVRPDVKRLLAWLSWLFDAQRPARI